MAKSASVESARIVNADVEKDLKKKKKQRSRLSFNCNFSERVNEGTSGCNLFYFCFCSFHF